MQSTIKSIQQTMQFPVHMLYVSNFDDPGSIKVVTIISSVDEDYFRDSQHYDLLKCKCFPLSARETLYSVVNDRAVLKKRANALIYELRNKVTRGEFK